MIRAKWTHELTHIFAQIPLSGALKEEAEKRRNELVEIVADADEELGELFLMEEPIDSETLIAAIRRAVISLKFVPIFMGRYLPLLTPSYSMHAQNVEIV